jgi:hypothetical protein
MDGSGWMDGWIERRFDNEQKEMLDTLSARPGPLAYGNRDV